MIHTEPEVYEWTRGYQGKVVSRYIQVNSIVREGKYSDKWCGDSRGYLDSHNNTYTGNDLMGGSDQHTDTWTVGTAGPQTTLHGRECWT